MAWHIGAKINLRMNEPHAPLPPAGSSQSVEPVSHRGYSVGSGLSRKHSASLSGLIRNIKRICPSRRPEKGHALRGEGYRARTEAPEDRARQRRSLRATIGPPGTGRDISASNRIVQWNIATELPGGSCPPRLPLPRRAVSTMTYRGSDNHHRDPDVFQSRVRTSGVSQILTVQHTAPQDWRSAERRVESLRRRRSLKENGDYLGVQGINPQTGQLDISSTSESELSNTGSIVDRLLAKSGARGKETNSVNLILKEAMAELKRERETERQRLLSSVVYWKRQSKQWTNGREASVTSVPQSGRRGKPVSRARQLNKSASPKSQRRYCHVGPGTFQADGRRSAAHSPDSQLAEALMKIPGRYPTAIETEDGIADVLRRSRSLLWMIAMHALDWGGAVMIVALQAIRLVVRIWCAYWDLVLHYFVYVPNREKSRLRDVITMILSVPLLILALLGSIMVFEVADFMARRTV